MARGVNGKNKQETEEPKQDNNNNGKITITMARINRILGETKTEKEPKL